MLPVMGHFKLLTNVLSNKINLCERFDAFLSSYFNSAQMYLDVNRYLSGFQGFGLKSCPLILSLATLVVVIKAIQPHDEVAKSFVNLRPLLQTLTEITLCTQKPQVQISVLPDFTDKFNF